jgi:hypothetical protein
MIAGVSALALLALIAVSHSAHREVEMVSLKEGDKGQVDTVKRDNGSGTKSSRERTPDAFPSCPILESARTVSKSWGDH